MANDRFERTVKLKTEIDVSDLISKLEQVKKTIQGTSTLEPKEIEKLNEAIEKASKKGAELKNVLSNGLTSKRDVEQLDKITTDFEKLIGKLQTGLSNANETALSRQFSKIADDLTKATDKIKDALETQKILFTKTASDINISAYTQDLFNAAIKNIDYSEISSNIINSIQGEIAKLELEYGEKANKVQKEIEKSEKQVNTKQQALARAEKELNDAKASTEKIKLEGYSDIDSITKKIKDLTQQLEKLKQLQQDLKNRSISDTTFANKFQQANANIDPSNISGFKWLVNKNIAPTFQFSDIIGEDKGREFIRNIISTILSSSSMISLENLRDAKGITLGGKTYSLGEVATPKIGWEKFYEKLSAAWSNTPGGKILKDEASSANIKNLNEQIQQFEQALKGLNGSDGLKSLEDAVNKAKAALESAENKLAAAQGKKTQIEAEGQQKVGEKQNQINTLQTNVELQQSYEKIANIQQQIAAEEKDAEEKRAKVTEENEKNAKILQAQEKYIKTKLESLKKETKEARSLSSVYETINKNFDQVVNRISYMFSALSIFRTVVRGIRQTLSDVQNLDKAFGSIAMVTSMNLKDLWGQYSTYAAIANKLGQQTQSAIEASALYYQQGLQTSDVMELTESTMKLATLAGQNFTAATKEMTAAIRAFNMEMSEGERITDVYSELAANAAADVNGIATAMSKVASIAASSGSKFENIAAFLTQIIETTQEAATNAGTALKTVIARFSELKENVDTTDIDLEEVDYNKMDKALKTVGINLKDATGQIRAFDEVVLELGAIWDTLSRNQQRYIATVAAGSRQQSRFLALMENNERLLELIQIAEESSGKSQVQFDKYADTIAYRLNQIKNTWEQFRTSLLNAESFKKAIGYFNTLLQRISKWTAKDLLTIGTAFTLLGSTAATGFMQGLKSASLGSIQLFSMIARMGQEKIADIGQKLATKIQPGFPSKISNFLTRGRFTENQFLTTQLYDSSGYLTVNPQKLTRSQKKLISQWYETGDIKNIQHITKNQELKGEQARTAYIQQQQKAREDIAKLQGQAYGTTFATSMLTAITSFSIRNKASNVFADVLTGGLASAATSTVNVFVNSIQQGLSATKVLGATLTTGLTTAAITALVALGAAALKSIQEMKQAKLEAEALKHEFYSLKDAISELKEEEEKLNEKVTESNKNLETSKDEYEQLITKIQKYKELNEKGILNISEQEELKSISEELAEIAPELYEGYDKEGVAIINLSYKYDELIKKKRELYAEDAKANADLQITLTNNKLQQAELEKQSYESLKGYVSSSDAISRVTMGSGGITGVNPLEYAAGGAIIGTILAGLAAVATGGVSLVPTLVAIGGSATVGAAAAAAENSTKNYAQALEEAKKDPALQSALKEIFQEDSVFDITGKEGEDIVTSIAEKIQKDEAYRKLFERRINEFIEQNKNYDKEINELKKKMPDDLSAQAEARLINNQTYYEETDDFLKRMMVNYVKYKAGLEYVEQDYKNARMREEVSLKGMSKDDKEKALANWEIQYFTDLADKVAGTDYLKDVDFSIWKTVQEDMEKGLPANELAVIIKNKLGDTSAQVQAWIKENKKDIEIAEERAKEIASAFGETLATTNEGLRWNGVAWEDFSISYFSDNSPLSKAFSQFGEKAQENFLTGYQSANNKAQFIQDIKNLLASVGPEEFSTIFNDINWDDYTILTRDSFFEGMSEGAKKAQPMLEHWFANLSFSSDALLEEMSENLNKELKEKAFDAWEKAAKSQIENGFVDETAISALNKAGANLTEIINEDATLNEQALEKWTEKKVDEAYNVINSFESQLQKEKSAWEAILNSYNKNLNSDTIKDILERAGLSTKEAESAVSIFKNSSLSPSEYAKERIEILNEELSESEKIALAYVKTIQSMFNATYNEIEEKREKAKKDEEDLQEKQEKTLKNIKDAYDDIIKKQEALAEAQKKLNDTLYGSSTHESSLDKLYNYQTILDTLNDSITEIKDNLEDLNGLKPRELLDSLFSASRSKVTYLEAENKRYDSAIKSTYNSLTGQVNDYMKTIGNGAKNNVSDLFKYNSIFDRYEINQNAINNAEINDNLKNFIEEQIDLLNQYKKKISENGKEIKKTEKDLEDYRKKIRDNYLSVEEEVIKKLEEYYKKQVEDKKEMYDALTEADDEYLDALQKAIDKQRKLRNQQDKWNELSEKEKKLSLIQRDTSGSKQKEIQKLQKEIQKDRTSMLDTAVDNIVNELKELYETQKETREEELKYQESIVENSSYVAEANAIMQSWKSLDDMRAWMWEHTEGIENMSDAAVEKLTDDWKTMFDNIQIYNELQQMNIKEKFENVSADIDKIINTTTDSLVSEANRAFKEIKETVNDSIKSAQEAVKNAMDALTESQEKYNEALKEYEELQAEIERLKTGHYVVKDNSLPEEYKNNRLEGIARDEAIKSIAREMYNTSAGPAELKDKYSDLDEDILWEAWDIANSKRDAIEEQNNRIDKIRNEQKDLIEAARKDPTKFWDLYNSYDNENDQVIVKNIIAEELREMLPSVTSQVIQWLLDGGILYNDLSKPIDQVFKEELINAHFPVVDFDNQEILYSINKEALVEYIQEAAPSVKGNITWLKKYKKGGPVDYTGLAYVDGSRSHPEYFLNSEDTLRIGQAASILRDLVSYTNGSLSNISMSPNVRESNTEIHIHVDSIATESQVDYLIDKIKEEIVDAANPIGSSVILH